MKIKRMFRDVQTTIEFMYDADEPSDVAWMKELKDGPLNNTIRQLYERVTSLYFVGVGTWKEEDDKQVE